MNERSDNPNRNIIDELICKSLDGTITRAECEMLNDYVVSDADTAACYIRSVRLHWALKRKARLCQLPRQVLSEQGREGSFLEELAAYEKIAPPIEVPRPAVQTPVCPEPIRAAQLPRKVSKTSIVSLILSAAALIFVVLFARFAPVKSGLEVATLTDSINAKWDASGVHMQIGDRFATGMDKWLLREGLAEIVFDNDASVIVEAPAEFQVLTTDQIKLNYGRLYAVVPDQAYGFTIRTPNSRIIDLGTEFGIKADVDGGMEVHVTRGKVNFLSGLKGNRVNLEVKEGSAQLLDAASGELKSMPSRDDMFVRDIDSKLGVVWKGQDRIDLADLVGGGNGFGTGRRGSCIDPGTGDWVPESGISGQATVKAQGWTGGDYHPASRNRFVDGVFVPNGQDGPIKISSVGHLFEQVPVTSGRYWGGVVCSDGWVLGMPLNLDTLVYGTPQRPALYMHTNAGITFDLEAIRQLVPHRTVTVFSTVYGMSPRQSNPSAEFWVLVDGQVRFCRKNVRSGQSGTIHIPLTETERFLTLATIEGEDGTPPANRPPTFDTWCLFGMPSLELE